ncbi:hypothetical protein PAXINDRAFT_85102, partial [Paxillus involutus ATCC 200175]
IKSALSPQEVRDHIMDPTLPFQKQHQETYKNHAIEVNFTGTMDDVKKHIDENETKPTETLPVPPPAMCPCAEHMGQECDQCNIWMCWLTKFNTTVDDIFLHCNIHHCSGMITKDLGIHGTCKARFPRERYPNMFVNTDTGALLVKKGEPMMNTVSDIISYLFRCNTDVTSLLSGTAIKAVVAYVIDYITKSSLCTYTIFDTIQSIMDCNSEFIGMKNPARL